MHVTLENNGVIKNTKVGFSWTMLFFGFLVPLFRSDFKWSILSLIAAFCTAGISWLIFPFVYNKIYIKDLLEKGYKPASDHDKAVLSSKGIAMYTKQDDVNESSEVSSEEPLEQESSEAAEENDQ